MAIYIQQRGEGQAHLVVEKVAGHLWRFGLIQSQDHQAIRLVALIELLENGHLDPAGGAPSGPEVDDDRPATEVGQAYGLAIQVVESEIVGGVTHFEKAIIYASRRDFALRLQFRDLVEHGDLCLAHNGRRGVLA